MKILHILDHSLPLHSGYTFRSQEIMKSQLHRGWEPVVLTSPKHEQSWKGPWNWVEEIQGVRYYRTGALSHNSIPLEPEVRLMVAMARRIKRVAELERPDIFHAHSPVLNAIPALWVGRKLGIPVVYEIRAFWEDAGVDLGTYNSGNSLKYRAVKAAETWVCRKASQVGVLCEGLRKDLLARGISADKMTIVYNGINPDDFKPTQPDPEYRKAWGLEGKTIIGFIGSFYHYEGLDLLIKAFQRLASQPPRLHASQPSGLVLLLVGGGETEFQLKQLIEKLDGRNRSTELYEPTEPNKAYSPNNPIDPINPAASQLPSFPASPRLCDRIIFPGRIPHDRIPGVYALIDILVYPRYPMRLTDLVTPLKPLEAMAMGKALVASDVGGHRELIRHEETGLLFPAGDVNALAKTIERLLTDGALRHRLETTGPTWVREYHTWEKTTSVYQEMYRKALVG